MHQRLQDITEEIVGAQDALLRAYDPKDLYHFRVAARRIRSILKQIDSHRSRLFRKAWGGLAAVTGDARDWDVFLAVAGNLLDPGKQKEFEAINTNRVAKSHENVINMLKSSVWKRHLLEWQDYLEQAEETVTDPERARGSLDKALHKSARRLAAAQVDGSDHRWHRYRIAIKELRYVSEACPELPGTTALADSCKALQTLLGDWHDTVVQLNLLEELPAADVHEELAARIRDRKAGLLSKMAGLPPIDQPEW